MAIKSQKWTIYVDHMNETRNMADFKRQREEGSIKMDHTKTGYRDASCVKQTGYRIHWYALVVVVVGMMNMKLDTVRG